MTSRIKHKCAIRTTSLPPVKPPLGGFAFLACIFLFPNQNHTLT